MGWTGARSGLSAGCSVKEREEGGEWSEGEGGGAEEGEINGENH